MRNLTQRNAPRALRLGLLAAGVLAAIVLAAFLLFDMDPGKRLSVFPEEGQHYVYEVALETHVVAPQGSIGHFKLTGEWNLTATKEPADRKVVSWLANAALDSKFGDGAARNAMRQASSEFARPLLVQLGASGAVESVSDSVAMRLQTRSMLKSLIASAQFVRSARSASWTTEEADIAGTYTAKYQETARAGDTFSKQKTGYRELKGVSDAKLGRETGLRVDKSRSAFVFGEDGVLARLSSDETIVASGKLVSGVSTRTTLTLRLIKRDANLDTPPTSDAAMARLYETKTRPGFSAEADHARVAGRDFATLLQELDDLEQLDPQSEEAKRMSRRNFTGMAASFRLSDDAADQALEAVEDGSPHSHTIWNALGSAGTAHAQDVLRKIIDMERWDLGERRSQMISLSMVSTPTRETVDYLAAKFSDAEQGGQARYGVGTAINRLKDQQPEEADRALAILTGGLQHETKLSNKIGLLEAIGNSGYVKGLPAVQPYLASEDPQLRAAATTALRLMPGQDIDAMLGRIALDDASTDVRAKAVEMLADRESNRTNVENLYRAALQDMANEVGQRARTALSAMAQREPRLQGVLDALDAELLANQG